MDRILKIPDDIDILRKGSRPVGEITQDVIENLSLMARLMYKYDGIGLAAPQVGIGQRLIIVDIGKGLLKMINPEVVKVEGDPEPFEEGCLSVPEETVQVFRPVKKVYVKALNSDGKEKIWECSGLLARAVQHEIDHLNGKLIIDYRPL